MHLTMESSKDVKFGLAATALSSTKMLSKAVVYNCMQKLMVALGVTKNVPTLEIVREVILGLRPMKSPRSDNTLNDCTE